MENRIVDRSGWAAIDVVPVMGVVCAYCSRVIRAGVEPVSHGACPSCMDEQRTQVRARAQVQANEQAVGPRVLAWKKDRSGCEPIPVGDAPSGASGVQAPALHLLLAGGIPRAVAAGRPDRDEPARPTRFLIESPARLRTFLRDNYATVILVAVLLLVSAWHTWGAR